MVKVENTKAMCEVAKHIIDNNGIEIAAFLNRCINFGTVNKINIKDYVNKNSDKSDLIKIFNEVINDSDNDTTITSVYDFDVKLIMDLLPNLNLAILTSDNPVYLMNYPNSRIVRTKIINTSNIPNTAIIIFKGGNLYNAIDYTVLYTEILRCVFDNLFDIGNITEEEFSVVIQYIYLLSSATRINRIAGRVIVRIDDSYINRHKNWVVQSDVDAIISIFKPIHDKVTVDRPVTDVTDQYSIVMALFSNAKIININNVVNSVKKTTLPYLTAYNCDDDYEDFESVEF